MRVILLVSFVLLLVFMLVPVVLPRLFGAPAIAVLGVGGIYLFGTGILIDPPMSRGMPAATLTSGALASRPAPG